MNSQYLDIILFGALAVFLAFRLRSVLGKRNGEERPPGEQFQRNPQARAPLNGQANGQTNGPNGQPADGLGRPAPRETEAGAKIIDLSATRLSATITAGLTDIVKADPSFDINHFMRGAKQAFELIVKAFSEGDTATLRLLLSDDVYDTFAGMIRQRLAAKETVESKIVSLEEPVLTDASLTGRTATLTLKFVSQQISVIRAEDNSPVEGDEHIPAEHVDHWSFARNTRSSDPNWALVATGSSAE